MDPCKSSGAACSRPIMTRSRTRLEGVGNPGADPRIFLAHPNAPIGPRDIVIDNEHATVKIEVKEEPSDEGDLEIQEEIVQENEPARKRVKVEAEDITGESVIIEDVLHIPTEYFDVNEEEQGVEQADEVDDEIGHEREENTPFKLGEEIPSGVEDMAHPETEDILPPVDGEKLPPSKVDGKEPAYAPDIEAAILKQKEKVFDEISKLNSLVETLYMQSESATTAGDHATEYPDRSEDHDPIVSTFASCQAGRNGGDHDVAQTKMLELIPEVIKVYWEKYARFQPNSRDLLNLNCRLACKIWMEGMDKVLEGEYTPLRNVHPMVIIPHGDVAKTVEVVDKVIEAYKNDDLTVCPFPPRVLKVEDLNTTQTVQSMNLSRATILKFIEKFGSGLKEFKYYGIVGEKKLVQFTTAADWYLTVVGIWIEKMQHLEKLTMWNTLDDDLHFLLASFRLQKLSDELAVYTMLFPKLKNLKSLDERLMPFSVVTGALLVNSHVEHVHCFSNCINDHNGRLKEGLNFPKLRSISYTDDNCILQLNPRSIFRDVEKFELDNSANSFTYLDLSAAFRFVERLNENKLSSLHFKFPNCLYNPLLGTVLPPGRRNYVDRLEMFKLKELSITFFQGDAIRPGWIFPWTEDNIVKMCSDLQSLEKLEIFAYRIEEINWKEDVRKLKLLRIKKLLRARLVNRLLGVLTNLKMVEIQPALSEPDGVTVMKSLYFIRDASNE